MSLLLDRVWWVDNYVLRHRIRLVCAFDLWRFGRTDKNWSEAWEFVNEC